MAYWMDNMVLTVKVDKESMLGTIHELEKQYEMLGRTIAELKKGIEIEKSLPKGRPNKND